MLFLCLPVFSSDESAQSILNVVEEDQEVLNAGQVCPTELPGVTDLTYKDFSKSCADNEMACFEECKAGSANHCFNLAYILQARAFESHSVDRLYAMACKGGHVSGCTNFAAGLMRFAPERNECYASSFRMTCERGDGWGCTMYGFVLHTGDGVQKDLDKAMKALEGSCAIDPEHEACSYAKRRMALIAKEVSEVP